MYAHSKTLRVFAGIRNSRQRLGVRAALRRFSPNNKNFALP